MKTLLLKNNEKQGILINDDGTTLVFFIFLFRLMKKNKHIIFKIFEQKKQKPATELTALLTLEKGDIKSNAETGNLLARYTAGPDPIPYLSK